MSSGNTGRFFLKGKILFHIAENGRSFDMDCHETTPIEEIMRRIESLSGISFDDQLVLYFDMDFESLMRQFSAYKLPCDEGEVFIFNKARLQKDSLPPPPEQVDIPHFPEPTIPSSSQNPHPLDGALEALHSYEPLLKHLMMKYEHCERLLRELMVQERAVEFALGELDRCYRAINQNYGDLIEHYKRQHQQHSDLLSNFERNVKKLKSTGLHPALQTSTYKCLMDFMKEEKNLRESAKLCTNFHKQFRNEVLQFERAFSEVKRGFEVCLSHKHKDEKKSIMQSLSNDVITVKNLARDCLSSQLSLPLRPHDAVSALDSRYNVHGKDHLPRMQTCDHDISNLLEICKERKNEMNMFVHNFMQNITSGSDLIKYQKLHFTAFKNAMTDQDDLFKDLKLFHGIGPAYRACFVEVVRRKASKKLYKGLGESLAKNREIETQKRLEFLRAHDSCIPDDVLQSMGLSDLPSKCDITFVERFDENLLDIDTEDVDRYAPEYLAEFSSALSTDSSHPTKAKDIHSEPEDPPDGIEWIEISGTSRMEDEIAKLKAKLSAIMALLCSLCPEVEYESLGDDKGDGILKTAAEKKAEALQLTDECIKLTETMLRLNHVQCVSDETRIRELKEEMNQVKARYNKEVNKEKISMDHLEVDEIAAFGLNASGHYQAITRDHKNYYLSTECVAKFALHRPPQPNFLAKIVHIERQVVKAMPLISTQPKRARVDQPISDTGTDRVRSNSGSASNPYGLPTGCVYFVLTVEMLPEYEWT